MRVGGLSPVLSRNKLLAAAFLAGLLAAVPCGAQLTPPAPSDPLARIRAAAANNQACTVDATSPCAQANPKIIAAAESSTTLDANLRRLVNGIGQRVTGSSQMNRAVAWAVAAFKAAGVDEVHTEKYTVPAVWAQGRSHFNMLAPVAGGENVVAEIRGRDKPDEFVILSSHLDSWDLGKGALDAGCNAALVIEAAHIIHLTGLRPRRTIRFVLFSGSEQGKLGSWGYVQEHRGELDRVAAAISFDRGTGRVNGFTFGGRNDIEAGVRESLTAFDSSWGITRYSADATLDSDNLDFLFEGVPNVLASQENAGYIGNRHSTADIYDKIDLATLKRNTAVAGVLAFGLAEREMPLGPRLSRAETETLLERTGLAASMRQADLWTLWQSQARGRLP
jgi:Zn-dependent M28 family amino/carboxypeptidase